MNEFTVVNMNQKNANWQMIVWNDAKHVWVMMATYLIQAWYEIKTPTPARKIGFLCNKRTGLYTIY